MKKFLLIFCFTLLISVFYFSAAPKLELPPSLNLGEWSRNETVTTSFSIKNVGNVTLTNIIPVASLSANFNTTGFNLSVNKSKTIGVSIVIPKNSATGNVTIGSIQFTSNEFTSPSFPLIATVRGGLAIEDLDVTLKRLDGRTKTITDLMDGSKIDFGTDRDVRPGSTLQFDIRVENLFIEDDEDIKIQDVSVLITIKEIDDEEDIDEESEDIDLDPEEKEDFTVTLEIPLKVDAGTYDVEILVEGEDEEGIKHTVEWDLELEVKKESHAIFIDTAYLTQDKLSCSRTTSLKTKIFNLGNREEDEVKIEAKNSNIGLDFVQRGISLSEDPFDDDSEFERTIPIVVSDDVRAGTYPIDFRAYYKENVLLSSKTVELIIEDCETDQEEELPEEETEIEIKSFEECEKAGYEIREIFPRECVTPDGDIFIEEVIVEESEEIPILEQEITVTKEKEPVSMNRILIIVSLIMTVIIIIIIVSSFLFFSPKPKKR